jgi:hypothetical protein
MRLGRPQSWSECGSKEKKSLLLLGIEPQTPVILLIA